MADNHQTIHITEPLNLTIKELIPRAELWARLDTLYNHLKDAQRLHVEKVDSCCHPSTEYLYELRNAVVGEIQLIKEFLYMPHVQFEEDSKKSDGQEA